MLLSSLPPGSVAQIKIKKLIFENYSFRFFYPATKAMMAVKNELHRQQFANTAIARNIAEYESSLDTLKSLEDLQAENLNSDIRPYFKAHFNNNAKQDALMPDSSASDDYDQFSEAMNMVQSVNNKLASSYKKTKARAVSLIGYLKKEFQL